VAVIADGSRIDAKMTKRGSRRQAERAAGKGGEAAAVKDTERAAGAGAARRAPPWGVAAVLTIPLVVVLLYAQLTGGLQFGSVAPRASSSVAPSPATAPATQAQEQAELTAMAARLAQRLEREPNDAEGWSTLAHTYYVLQRFPEAVKAYERLVAIAKPDASTLADYADTLAMAQGRSLAGKPMELVRKAIELDPSQWKAQSMAATDAFLRKDYASAIGHWERALASVPAGSELARALEANIAEARQLSSGR
jgi:cytochrome c-type biogenesis protein CcmH